MPGRGDTRARARARRQSIEDAARRLRYDFLAQQAKRLGASAVLLGHTADDQAETVLLHLVRGSGLQGLAAMRPRSAWPLGAGPEAGRPLLALGRADTERYCREQGINPREDPTNQLPAATRNRVRHQILPGLRSINPRVTEALCRLADLASSDVGYLEHVANAAFHEVGLVGADAVSFEREALNSLPGAISRRVVRLGAAHLAGSPSDLEAQHVDRVLALLAGRPRTISLPQGLVAVSDSQGVTLTRGGNGCAEPIPETELTIPGRIIAGAWLIEAQIVAPPEDPRGAAANEAYLDADALRGAVTVRSRRPGDRLRPLGLSGEKKVQDILVDAKVPARLRDGVPLVADAGGVLWVVGHCLDARAAVGPRAGGSLRLTFLFAER